MMNLLRKQIFLYPSRSLLCYLCVSALALAGAYISQYGFGHQPCNLCIYQRIPYGVVIGLSIIGLLLHSKRRILLVLMVLCSIAFAVEMVIAAFHVGVEQKWWEGLDTCGGGDIPMTIEALRAQIANAPLARCDDPSFVFLGITMAAWNVLYALGLLIFSIFAFVEVKRISLSEKAVDKQDEKVSSS